MKLFNTKERRSYAMTVTLSPPSNSDSIQLENSSFGEAEIDIRSTGNQNKAIDTGLLSSKNKREETQVGDQICATSLGGCGSYLKH